MLPTTDSRLEYKGEFYLGYETAGSTVIPVVMENTPRVLEYKLALNSTEQNSGPLIGLISPYYWHYMYLI